MKKSKDHCLVLCRRVLIAAAMVCCALAAASAETIYTVTVDGGTRESPVLLDSVANVTVESGGSITTKAFSEVYGDFSSGAAVFRKRGSGWLKSSVNMATFTGEIRVEEGAFVVDESGMTGPANASTAPTVVVSNGASFAISGTGKNTALYNDFHLNGSGVNGYGAIANLLGVSITSLFKNKLTLDSDVLICGDSAYTCGLGWKKQIDFAGHTLTVKSGEAGRWTFLFDSAEVVSPGHIIVDGATLKVQGTGIASWPGSAANTLKLKNGGRLDYYQTKINLPWTLITESGSTIAPTVGPVNNSSIYSADPYDYWDGPVAFSGDTMLLMAGTNYGFTVNGPISGSGSVYGSGGWLQLGAASPAFTGSIAINNGTAAGAEFAGLSLTNAGAITAASAGLAFTNATLRLAANGQYELPKLAFHAERTNQTLRLPVTGDQAVGLVRPATGSTAAGLKVSGSKTLSVEGDLSVTGVLEIASGCLELPGNPHAGFVSGMSGTRTASPWCSDLAYGQTRAYYTNSVVRTPLQLYSNASGVLGYSNCVTWVGYVWNRSGVAQNWTFAFAVNRGTMFMFEGVRTNYWNAATYTKPNLSTLTMQPGANLIGIRVYGLTDGGGVRTAAELNKAQWRDGFGVGVDRQGRNSTNAADYESLADPGDGSFITVSADGSLPDAEPEWKLSFSHLKIAPGAVLEAKGNDLALKTVEGIGTVRNGAGYFKGRLAISDSWTVSAADIAAGNCLSVVDGSISFGENCTLDFSDIAPGVLSHSTQYVLARATEGIEGLPSNVSTDLNGKYWHLEKAVEPSGSTVLKGVWHKGFVMSFR